MQSEMVTSPDKMVQSWVIAVTLLGVFVGVHSLQCYSCLDCEASSLTDSHLTTCGETSTSTSSSTTSTSTTTTTPTSTTTTTPTSTSTTTPISTTTTTPTNTTTTTPTSTTTTTPTNTTTTTPTSTTTTTPATTTTTTTITTTTTTPRSESEPEKPEQPESEDGSRASVITSVRVRRNIQSELGSGCFCEGVKCACAREAASRAEDAQLEYVCLRVSIKDSNGTETIGRGCVLPTVGNKTICEFLTEQGATDCRTCNTDKCNSAYGLQNSVIVLLFILSSVFLTA